MATNVGPALDARGRKAVQDPQAPVTEEQARQALALVLQVLDQWEVLAGNAVALLRTFGRSWAYIGQCTGLTAEGARLKYQDACDEAGLPRRIGRAQAAELARNLPPAAAAFGPLAAAIR